MFDKIGQLKDLWKLKSQMDEIKKRLDNMVIKVDSPHHWIGITISGSQEVKEVRVDPLAKNINEIYNTNIDVDLLVKENKTITRKNIYNYLVNHSDLDEKDIDFMVSRKSKAYVHMKRLTVQEGIDLLHENNAIAILAHPCLIDPDKLPEILEFNFDGIEAKYANIVNDYNYFKGVADRRGFFVSAGSDYHGDTSHGDLGDVYLEESEVKLVLDKLGINYGN